MGLEENDAMDDLDSCSICLEAICDKGDRSITKLKCGHEFHLDCIGSTFNAKGEMRCPNCRKIEKGQWLYANGRRSDSESSMDDWTHDEDLHETSDSEMVQDVTDGEFETEESTDSTPRRSPTPHENNPASTSQDNEQLTTPEQAVESCTSTIPHTTSLDTIQGFEVSLLEALSPSHQFEVSLLEVPLVKAHGKGVDPTNIASSSAIQFPELPFISISSLPEVQRFPMQTLRLLIGNLSKHPDSHLSFFIPMVSHTLTGLQNVNYDISVLEELFAQATSSADQRQILMAKPTSEIAVLHRARYWNPIVSELETVQNDITRLTIAHQDARESFCQLQPRLIELKDCEKVLREKLEKVMAESAELEKKLSSFTTTVNETANNLDRLQTHSAELATMLENVEKTSAKIAGGGPLCESVRHDMIKEYDYKFRLLLQTMHDRIQP